MMNSFQQEEAASMKTQMIFRRYELKYLMTRRQRDQLLSAAEQYLVPDEFSHSSIRNLYLDTPDFRLIRRSLEGPVRSYSRAGRTAPVFVELKKKYRSVVYKRRLSLPQDQAMRSLYGESKWPDTQIGKEIAYPPAPLLSTRDRMASMQKIRTTPLWAGCILRTAASPSYPEETVSAPAVLCRLTQETLLSPPAAAAGSSY